MLDRLVQQALRPVMTQAARGLVRLRVGADAISFTGFAIGMAAAGVIAFQQYGVGLALLLLSRLMDGLDGAVARATRPTDRGGFLDITLDFLFYAAIPLAFAIADPTANALPAAVLLASFIGTGSSFLAFAAIAGTLGSVAEGAQALRFEGQIRLNGTDLTHTPTAQRGIGLLFQDALLFAHMTVAENLLFAVPPGPRAQRQAIVQQALAEAGLDGYGQRDPATLSGGQRARVALLRALLAQPRALLLDEPFSKLDAALREQFRAFVFGHIRARHIPAVLVTHDAADIADPSRIVELAHAG